MNTAYLGDGPKRRHSWKGILAALAMVLMPATAFAQEPPAAPEAPEVDLSIPGLEDPVADAPPVVEEAVEAAGEGEEAAAAEEGFTPEFSLAAVWREGLVPQITLVIMGIMLAGSIYVAATKAFEQMRLGGQLKRVGEFWNAGSIDEGLDALGRSGAIRDIAEGAIAEANNAQQGLGARIGRVERTTHRVGIELERVNTQLQSGMAWLATVGSIAPFVGLFGTVVGIIRALVKIGQTGDASIEKVAGPVGEALIMTAIGLGVAVPAVIFYNALGRQNKVLQDGVRHFAFDVEKLMATSVKS
ncbi:MAG: MotA/TolQ/ExbB proton channel family protein [Hyphomonadaceae bacterium]